MAAEEEVVIGPWTFVYVPDGDDPGVGDLAIHTESATLETEGDKVTRYEFHQFLRAARGGERKMSETEGEQQGAPLNGEGEATAAEQQEGLAEQPQTTQAPDPSTTGPVQPADGTTSPQQQDAGQPATEQES